MHKAAHGYSEVDLDAARKKDTSNVRNLEYQPAAPTLNIELDLKFTNDDKRKAEAEARQGGEIHER